MKGIRTLCAGFAVCCALWTGEVAMQAEESRSESSPVWDTYSDTWVATDALGRRLPTYAEVGPPRKNRTVGLFYFLWHGGLMGKNCKFFADMGMKQILSGYYDGDEDGASITKWIANTKDIPGIVGAMYTTWEDKYNAMDVWARKAWGGRKGN